MLGNPKLHSYVIKLIILIYFILLILIYTHILLCHSLMYYVNKSLRL